MSAGARQRPDGAAPRPAGLLRRGPLRSLLPFLRPEGGAVVRTAVVSAVSSAALVALGVLASYAVAVAVVDDRVLGASWWVAGTVLVVARAVLTWREMDLSHDVAYRVLARLRVALFDGLAGSTPARVGGRPSGDLAAAATADVEKLEFFYAHTLAQVVGAASVLAAGTVLAWWVDPLLAVVVLTAAAALVASSRVLAGTATAAGERAQERSAALSARVTELLAGRREVLGYGLARAAQEQLRQVGAEVGQAQARARVAAATAAGARDVVVVAAVVVAVLVCVAASRRGEVPPELVAPVVAGAVGVLAPVADLVATTTQLHQHRASARRVLAGVTAPAHLPEPTAPLPLPRGPLGLRLRGVGFDYGSRFALRDLDLEVAPRERVVLVGPSGTGKSTLAHLMTRWWDPLAGSVELVATDGSAVDVRQVADAELRRALALVGQDVHVFHGTLADNLRRAAPSASEADLTRVLDQVGLGDVVAALPEGVHAVVGQRGATLSGGQRARLALARALLRRPRVLVLDEATAYLDPASAAEVTALVQSLDPDLTVVTIAHRAATIAASGRVVDVAPLVGPAR